MDRVRTPDSAPRSRRLPDRHCRHSSGGCSGAGHITVSQLRSKLQSTLPGKVAGAKLSCEGVYRQGIRRLRKCTCEEACSRLLRTRPKSRDPEFRAGNAACNTPNCFTQRRLIIFSARVCNVRLINRSLVSYKSNFARCVKGKPWHSGTTACRFVSDLAFG